MVNFWNASCDGNFDPTGLHMYPLTKRELFRLSSYYQTLQTTDL
jgi:hypothetical protein